MTEVDFGRNPFELKIGESVSVLKFAGDLTHDVAKEYEKRLRAQAETITTDLVLDLAEAGSIHKVWTRSLMQIATQAKRLHRRIRVVSTNPKHAAFFQDQGVAASFPIVADLATAVRELTEKSSAKLNVAFINPFLEGTIEVLKRIAGVTAKSGTLGVKDLDAPLDGEISGMILLDTARFMGSVILSFPEKTYLAIASKMLGEAHEAITAANHDGVGEITNQVFGYAKRILNERDHQIKMALPTILLGPTPAELPLATGSRIAIPFESDVGPFTVEVRVRAN